MKPTEITDINEKIRILRAWNKPVKEYEVVYYTRLHHDVEPTEESFNKATKFYKKHRLIKNENGVCLNEEWKEEKVS
jgi:hypothetical protein